MRDEVRTDREQSDRRFLEIVWPIVCGEMGTLRGFRLMDEAEIRPLREELDRDSNVDFWAVSGRRRLMIANRVQVNFDQRTFTIRLSRSSGAPTEMAKMSEAVVGGYVHAMYQLHSYVRVYPSGNEAFMRAFGVRTDPLYEAIEAGRVSYEVKDVHDGNRMAVIEVDRLREAGVAVDEVDRWTLPPGPVPRDYRRGDRWLPFHFNADGTPKPHVPDVMIDPPDIIDGMIAFHVGRGEDGRILDGNLGARTEAVELPSKGKGRRRRKK